MTKEYKTAKGWRIFMYVASPALIGLFIYLAFNSITSETSSPTISIILLTISIIVTLIFVYGLIDITKGRFIIGDKFLRLISFRDIKTLEFNEVKGFRSDDNYIYIVSNKEGKDSIKVSNYTEKTSEILEWLESNFTELDRQEAKEEEQKFLSETKFGINQQAKEYRLNEAKRISKYINVIGGATALWLWLYPQPYKFSLTVGLILPLVAYGSLFIYRGLIRFDERKNSPYPSIIYGFLMPSAALLVRSVMDYEILDYKTLWVIVSVVSVCLTGLFIIVTKEIKFTKPVDYFSVLSLTGLLLCYSFGAYVISNCLFDNSNPEILNARVVDKEIGSGKTTIYYLKLEPWGPRTEIEKVSVTQNEYESTDKGDSVDIYLRPGLLKTPWFYVVTE